MKIIGIGNALLDVLLRLESDTTLETIGIKKGAMDLIDEVTMRSIQREQSGLERSEAPGGSVCNTTRALALLGASVGYIGKVGSDANGRFYTQAIHDAGVTPHIVQTDGISGCCTVLMSPDSERTMATFLGPAATLTAEEITDDVLRMYNCLYMEGYLISNEQLFYPILRRAKKLGLKIALDLSNFNIVHGFYEMLHQVIPEYVDILFSNDSEAEAYTGLAPAEAIREIMKDVEYSVVTVGRDGALAGHQGETVHVPALSHAPVDTTGAGDNFAAGFLYGYSRGGSLKQMASIGAVMASHVVETVGPQIPADRWQQIKIKVGEIIS